MTADAPQTTPPTQPPQTPMMAQYLELKRQYADSVLFYRMGDFYEMFHEDALKAAPILEVQLTSRDRNAANQIPMCGVPHHSATLYIQKLLAAGIKVALCEQADDPATTKGLLRREVVRVITPGLIGDPDLVPEETQNFLYALHPVAENEIEICQVDLLGGALRVGTAESADALLDFLQQYPPREILVAATHRWVDSIPQLFPRIAVSTREAFFVAKGKESASLRAIRAYLVETQKTEELNHFSKVQPLFVAQHVTLDGTSLASLEILKNNSDDQNAFTLFRTLDRTHTPMGRRLLKDWLARPLCQRKAIQNRLDAVETFVDNPTLREDMGKILSTMRDLERLTSKTALGLALPRDLVAIRSVLELIPAIVHLLKSSKSTALKDRANEFDPLKDLTEELSRALEDAPPVNYREGGIFRETFDPGIAEYRKLTRDTKEILADMEVREKARTGISSLKLKYSKVFGYTIEITKSHLTKVPPEYIRKQTIANGERYITEELKEFEHKVLSAEHKLVSLEEGLFLQLRRKVAEHAAALLQNAKRLAELDALLSFSVIAGEKGYVRPEIHSGYDLEIVDGRHPVVESLLPQGAFVPNSMTFSEEDCRTIIITGPNMAGKSTIMRQTALIVLMAHAGSFVPATRAQIPLTDAIYTRIGSSDDLARGRSTFMVEMLEMSRILKKASSRSLIIVDEIGRGTSTYDGLSLAWSLVEYIHTTVRAKTLFATHFQEVTALEKSLPALQNANVAVQNWKSEIVFLHKLVKGVCQKSYGIEVARLADLPSEVLTRAKTVLGHLESQSQRGNRARQQALETRDNQMAFTEQGIAPENRSQLES